MRINHQTFEMRSKIIPTLSLILGLGWIVIVLFIANEQEEIFRSFKTIIQLSVLLAFWNFIPAIKLPAWLSSSAFPIFLMHVLVWRVLEILSSIIRVKLLFLNPSNGIDWMIKFSLGFGIPIFVAYGVRRIAPRFASMMFGGR